MGLLVAMVVREIVVKEEIIVKGKIAVKAKEEWATEIHQAEPQARALS